MLKMKILAFATILLVVEGDLLDLYVQHMDEIMETNLVKKHPKDIGSKLRSKRHLKSMRFSHFRKQRLDVDDDWWIDKKMLKKSRPKLPLFQRDDPPFPNSNESTNNGDRAIVKDKQDFAAAEGFSKYSSNKDFIEFADFQQVPSDGINEGVELISDVDDASEILWKDSNRISTKYHPTKKIDKDQKSSKQKRSVRSPNFTRCEVLDDVGDVTLEWDPSDEEIVTFRVTARTLGYVGIGFNDKSHMMGADLLLAWVDDHDNSVNILVSSITAMLNHGINSRYNTAVS